MNNLRRIVSAIEVPVTVDLESGYGDASDAVGMTVCSAIEIGAVGGNLEDSFPATRFALNTWIEGRGLWGRCGPAVPVE